MTRPVPAHAQPNVTRHPDVPAPLTDDRIAREIQGTVQQRFAPVNLLIGLVGGLSAVFALAPAPTQRDTLLLVVMSFTGLVFAITGALARRWPIPLRWAHPLTALMVLIALTNNLVHVAILSDYRSTLYLLMSIFGTGLLLFSVRWTLVSFAYGLLGWLALSPRLAPAEDFTFYLIILLQAMAFALIAMGLRWRTMRNALRSQFARDAAEYERRLQERASLALIDARDLALLAAERRLAELQTVQEVARVINSAAAIEQVFETLVAEMNQRFGYRLVSIYLRDDDGLVLKAAIGYTSYEPHIPHDRGINGRVLRTGQAAFVLDVIADPDFFEEEPGTQQIIVVPMIQRDGMVAGTICIESTGEPVLHEDDFSLLQTLADQVTGALLNAQLLAHTEHAAAALQHQNAELAALNDVTEQLIERLEIVPLLESLVLRAGDLLESEHGFLYLLDSTADRMVMRFGTGFYVKLIGLEVGRGVGIGGQIWVSQRSMFIEDYRTWVGRIDSLAEPDMRSVVGVPLLIRGECIGVLGVACIEGRDIAMSSRDLLKRFARLASLAIENARLYGEAQHEILERRRIEAEQRQVESKMLEVQKLESLGVLAGGIAHDFNNLIAIVLGNVHMALIETGISENTRLSLDQIDLAGRRATELTRQLLDYAGKGQLAMRMTDVGLLAQEMLVLLQTSVTGVIELRLDIAPNLPRIELDATQLRQVLMNLVLNGAEAITGAGTVVVGIATRMLDRSAIAHELLQEDLVPGEYLVLRVSDTGSGMDDATRIRIFDPFFTTKFTGRGLGLAAVLGIVRGHHGAIQVKSTLGIGTMFTVYLPVEQPLNTDRLRSTGLSPTERELLKPHA